MNAPSTDVPLIHVALLDVPIALRDRAQEHGDELIREMTLVALQSRAGDGDSLPVRLTQLAAELQQTYGAFVDEPDATVAAAARRGEVSVAKVTYAVPATAGLFARHIIGLLEETDEFCRGGSYLLALASPPDVRAYRMWALGEFERQARGLPPIPWPRYAESVGLPRSAG